MAMAMAEIHYFDTLPSTNKYCELLDLSEIEEFTCFCALKQTDGIGQGDHKWSAEPGKNLTFSIVLHPSFLAPRDHARLMDAISHGICDWVNSQFSIPNSQFSVPNSPFSILHSQLRIKLPNDIYVGDKKLCGTLITTRIQGAVMAHAIVGIGLNLNQTEFPSWVPNPTSLRLLTGREYPIETSLEGLLTALRARYEALRQPLA